jgi:hypothetical protein
MMTQLGSPGTLLTGSRFGTGFPAEHRADLARLSREDPWARSEPAKVGWNGGSTLAVQRTAAPRGPIPGPTIRG